MKTWKSSWWVFPLYLALAIALTYPLILQVATAVPNDLGDPLLNTWILWWNAQAVPYTSAWWNAPAFYPIQGALAFSEHLLGLSVISTPVQWLGGGPQLGYNLAFLLTFPLSALAAYLLGLELTGRRDAAFVTGLLFGFAPYRIAHFPHIQDLSSYWMPVALLGLHRYVRDKRASSLAVFGAGWILQALCDGYYMLFFSVLLVLWLLWFVRPFAAPRTFAAIMTAWVVAALPMMPILWRYRTVHSSFGFVRGFDEIRYYSADLAALLNAAGSLALWGWLHVYQRAEGELFPGLTIVVLLVAGAVVVGRGAVVQSRTLRVARGLLAVLAIATGLAALSTLVIGPWRIGPLSVSDPIKPLTEAIAFALALVFLSPPVVSAYHARSVLGFYAVAVFVMWLFSLGPGPTVLGHPLMYRGPYALLMYLPGFDALRAPARFAMVMTLCLAVVGGMLFDRLASRFRLNRAIFASIVALSVMAETWMKAMPLEPAPGPWKADTCVPAGQVVMDFPLGDPGRDLTVMYRSMFHDHPVVNGYSGYFPPHYAALRHGLSLFEHDLLTRLARLGVGSVVVDTSADPGGVWKRYVSSHPGAQEVCSEEGRTVYQLHADRPESAGGTGGTPLPILSVHANENPDSARLVLDGDLRSRWESGPQKDTTRVEIDLGSVRQLRGIVLSLGPFADDFPRALAIDASEDGQTWTEVWRGTGGTLAFVGAFQAPRELPLTFEVAETRARFMRLRLLSNDPVYYWSIAELKVLGR